MSDDDLCSPGLWRQPRYLEGLEALTRITWPL